MSDIAVPGLLALVSAAVTAACASIVATRAAQSRAARWFLAALIAQSGWSLGFVLELAAGSLGARIVWDDVQLVFAMALGVIVGPFAKAYAERRSSRPRLALAATAVLPLAATLFVLTDPIHGAARADAHLVQAGPLTTLEYTFSPIEHAAYLQIYATYVYAIAVVLWSSRARGSGYLGQTVAIVLWLGAPLLTYLLYLFGLHPFGIRDTSPFVFGVAGLVATWGLSSGRLFDLVPAAHAAVVEQAKDLVLVVDAQLRVIDMNPSARAVLGAAQPIGAHVDAIATLGPLRALVRAPESAPVDFGVGQRIYEARASALRARGEQRGVVVRAIDVTEQRHAQEVLRSSNERLERSVAERTRELEETARALAAENVERRAAEAAARESEQSERLARAVAEEAVRIRDEFLTIASHELRTPLTALQLAVQSLGVESGGETTPERAARTLALVSRQVARLGALVGPLLDVTRLRSGGLSLELAPVDLGATVESVRALLGREIARSGSEIVVVAPKDRVVGTWDGQRLEQVVTNLLTNAIKFGRGRPITIEISTSGDGSAARLVVADDGVGVEDELREHIFEPFRRGVSWRNYGGLGLGLYITHQIVDAHGGRIDVESEVGHGARFVVELPMRPRTAPGVAPRSAEATA